MGCITSSQKDVDNAPTGAVKALSTNMKTRFGNVDPDVLGDFKEEAVANLAFVYGRMVNIYLITSPPFHPAPKEEAYPAEQQAAGENAEGGEAQQEAAAAKEKPVEEVRWTFFNDSKSDARVESTFFHAAALRCAGSEESVKMERSDNGLVKASVAVPAGATVAFVEGPIKGYMYKCFVHDPRTDTFELAAPA